MPVAIAVFTTIAFAVLLISFDVYEAVYDLTRQYEAWELDEIILVGISALVSLPVAFVFYMSGQNKKLKELLDQHEALAARLTETNEQLVIASEAKSEFVATMSHEIRTPLTSIKGALGLVRSDTKGVVPEEVKKLLNIAYRNTDRLAILIDDILDYSKIEAGELEYNIEPLEVASLVELAVEANEGYGQQYGTTFIIKSGLPDAMIKGDENRLMQAFSNLMSNAAKFSPPNSDVEISVARHDGRMRFSVKDFGCGIPEEFRNQIFERFSRADQSNTRTVGGTGLGLNITAEIIKEHSGTIDFQTEIDVGTTFYFELPEYTAEEQSAAC
ncbi:MAG: hypothetical protein GKS00_29145 [Alphaproteobacteria bacterium]|nr:hypothetical protein [Alphaproteobacteria bacterium]